MKKNTKSLIKICLLSGFIYAFLMEGFHLLDGDPLKLWRFIFYFLFFGGAIGATRYYNLKKQKESDTKSKQNKNNPQY